jgi:putative proteasome-type protease
MDSTLKSNLSVGLPLDLLVYRDRALPQRQIVCIDDQNPYFQMMHSTWGHRLREVFEGIADPVWDGAQTDIPLKVTGGRSKPLGKIRSPDERLI